MLNDLQFGEAKLIPFLCTKGINFASPYCKKNLLSRISLGRSHDLSCNLPLVEFNQYPILLLLSIFSVLYGLVSYKSRFQKTFFFVHKNTITLLRYFLESSSKYYRRSIGLRLTC